jgi:hypothetical protein
MPGEGGQLPECEPGAPQFGCGASSTATSLSPNLPCHVRAEPGVVPGLQAAVSEGARPRQEANNWMSRGAIRAERDFQGSTGTARPSYFDASGYVPPGC